MSEWKDIEASAVELLKKIEEEVARRTLPRTVFEAHARTFKKISSELAIFNDKGEIWLIQRPFDPLDPYSEQWHLPGAMHGIREATAQAFERAMREVGNVPVEIEGEAVVEVDDGKRGFFHALLTVSFCKEMPKSEGNAGFFSLSTLPEPIVEFHKDLLIPKAVEIHHG